MIVPQAYQIETLLRYLRLALRIDPVCLAQLSSTPDEICTGALEIEPTETVYGPSGPQVENTIADTELPCLCARETGSSDAWFGPVRGQRGDITLWYVMRPPIGEPLTKLKNEGDSAGDGTYHKIPDWAAADRWLRIVWWRINYWLDTCEISYTQDAAPVPPATGIATWNLLTDGQIEEIGADRSARYQHRNGLAIIEANLEMTYSLPPYAASAASDLTGIEFTLTQQQPEDPQGPAVSGVITL